jgi:hypothetical protein
MPPNLDQGNRAPSARNRHLPFAEIAGVANSVLHRRAARLRVPFWNAGRRPRRDEAVGTTINKWIALFWPTEPVPEICTGR